MSRVQRYGFLITDTIADTKVSAREIYIQTQNWTQNRTLS